MDSVVFEFKGNKSGGKSFLLFDNLSRENTNKCPQLTVVSKFHVKLL